MAKKHHNNGEAPQGTQTAEGTTAETVDTETGEISGASESATQAGTEQSQAQASDVGLLKKIVAKDIVPRKMLTYKKDDDGKVIDPEPRNLYTVFGVAGGTIKGDSTYGPWLAFTGSFEAIRHSDRKTFASDKLFLQNPAEGLLLGALSAAKAKDANGTVQFAFDVGVKPSSRWMDTNEGNSYEYTCASRIHTSQNDPLAQLRQIVRPTLPALAAPTPPAT